MPIYEYDCGRCGQVFEVRQSMEDVPLQNHDTGEDGGGCMGNVSRRPSKAALKFKGAGFYVNDYPKGK